MGNGGCLATLWQPQTVGNGGCLATLGNGGCLATLPEPGGAEAFRRTIDADVGVNRLGIDASREGGLRFAFPVVIFSGVKP
jgi:hypothetical protein